jgi:hypothetical protein
MTLPRWISSASLHLAILRSAALVVPGPQRAEWFAEWRAELWYVKQSPTIFCLGAFRDAFWLRRNSPRPNASHTFGFDSPLRCVLFLTVLAEVSLFFAFRLPLPRAMLLPSPYRDAHNLVMISPDGHFADQVPTVSIQEYQLLINRTQNLFTGLAFYKPILTRVKTARRQTAELSIALASDNLFELLHIPVSLAAPDRGGDQHTAAVILSHATWRKYFDGDPRIIGRVLEVAGQQAVVGGVLSSGSWQLPGRVDAWLLDDRQHLAALPPPSKGFVLGHVRTPPPRPPRDWRWRIAVPNEQGAYDRFECTSLVHRQPILAHLLMIVVAVWTLSATRSLALGEYPAKGHSTAWVIRLRWWIFLGIKVAFILPIIFCGTLDVASIISSAGIQPPATLVGYVLAFRGALTDQLQRCPECLRLLTNPTRIGCPSQTFLEWYGTELICAKGHGLLHVPEIRTSCYSTQRWLYLDPSWNSLFS